MSLKTPPKFAASLTERVLAQSGDAISIVGADYRYQFVNPTYSHRTGIPVERIVGLHVADLMGEDAFRTVVRPQLDRCLGGEEIRYESWFDLPRHGRRCLAVQYSPLRGAGEEVEGVVVVSHDITEQALAEEALRQTEERLRLTLDGARAGAWEWDARTGAAVWSDRNFRLLGYEPGAVAATYANWLAAVHPDDRDYAAAQKSRMLEEGAALDLEYRVLWPDGRVRWVEDIAQVRRDGDGAVTGMIGIALDVTDRKQADAALRDSEERYRRIVETANEGVWSMDGDYRITFANAAMAKMLGYTPEEVCGLTLEFFLFDEDLPDHRRRIATRRAGTPEHYERRLRRKDGSACWCLVSATPRMDAAGRFAGSFAMLTDITERKRAEAALQRSEEGFRRTFDQAPIGAAMVSLDFRFLRVNAELCRMTGYSAEDLLGVGFPDITHPDDLAEDIGRADRLLAGEIDSYSMEKRYIRKNGEVVWVNLNARLIRDQSGEPLYYLPMITDIHRRKMAEAAMHKAMQEAERANAAKSRFIAAASHDLRQPLQSQLLLHSVLADGNQDPSLAPIVASMGAAIHAQQEMLNALLDISRLDAGIIEVNRADFPIAELFEQLTAEFGLQAKDRGLAFRAVPCRSVVHSDPLLLERILRNLVNNALNYTREGRILVGCRRFGASLRIQVWDTGVGIPEPHLAEIFEEFSQVPGTPGKATLGMGLGLAIVERLVRLLGYRVRVRSVPGKGSMFEIVDIPLGRLPAPPQPAAPGAAVAAMASDRPLLVVIDDDRPLLDALCVALKAAGHDVIGADTAEDALARLAAQRRLPEMIITDYRLRCGVTGSEVLACFNARFGKAIPGIILTGDTSPQRLREAKASGVLLLHKPVQPDNLKAEIRAILAGQAG